MEIYVCEDCGGSGRIFRSKKCCQNGCRMCNYEFLVVNPNWQELRMQGEANDELFPCRICGETV
jgi:hypothetical protein